MSHGRPAKPWEALTASMSSTIADNLRVALDVADEGDNNEIKNMTLAKLHRRTGIAKSTLFKIIGSLNCEIGKGKPDLETLCGLAWALNLPPAMLLMSSSDWKLLCTSVQTLNSLKNGHSALEKLSTVETNIEYASIGLKVAEQLGIYPEQPYKNLDFESTWSGHAEMVNSIRETNSRKKKAILTTTAVAQRGGKSISELETRTTIGAVFGANYRTI